MSEVNKSDLYLFQYVDRELIRNFLLAGAAVFIVVFLLVVDLRSSFFVLSCVVYTTVRSQFSSLMTYT